MAFPPGDGDGRVAGDGDISNEETTVLPPVDGDPALVRPYVRATGVEAEAGAPAGGGPESASAPQVWAADVEQTAVLPPVPHASAAPDVPAGPAGPRRLAAPVRTPEPQPPGPRRGKLPALAGGAVALILIGTGAALLTRPSGASPSATSRSSAQATATPDGVPSTGAAGSASPSRQASRSPRPTASPRTARGSASPGSRASGSPSSATQSGARSSLGPGSTGPAVAQLQQDLWQVHVDRSLKATGVYDQQTAQDVVDFQACMSVMGDPAGVYGPATQAAMQQALDQNTRC